MPGIKINESPNHFMVLDAISRGIKTVNKISRVTKLDKAEVELVINDLEAQRLVIKTGKKKLFGGMKAEYTISHTGLQLLNAKKAELEKQWQQVQQWYSNGDTAQMQSYMDSNRMWMPMMMFSGIMNVMFFMSMMSMMNMALSPAETGFAGDASAGADAGGAADGSGGDTGGADAGGADAGGGDFGGGDFGGGDFSF